MSILRHAITVGAVLFAASATADAQLRRTTVIIPDGQTMPAGTCRVWIDGIPANRQPAPTDCASARRNQPRNSRVIHGTRPVNVYGNRDPRSIPGSRQYDPRFDPRHSQYDPRMDPHRDRNRVERERWERERAVRVREAREAREREEWRRNQERERLELQRKQEREREQYQRKQEKEREKEWKKANKGNNGNHGNGNKGNGRGRDDDDDRRDGERDGRYGTVQQGCVDANRDGRCDGTATVQTYPRPVTQTVPQTGTTRRVCADVNRDGKCDDGGPLVRTTP